MNGKNEKYDDIVMKKRWSFNEDVSNCFENMIERSIPGYGRMRAIVYAFGRRFVKKNTCLVDLGCSNGMALSPFIKEFGQECCYIGIESSPSMAEKFRERYQEEIASDIVTLFQEDIVSFYPDVRASLVLSVLTLQFVDVHKRDGIIKRAYESLIEGGALILAEKTSPCNSGLEPLFEDVYFDFKRGNGYTDEQIFSKKSSLEKFLIPLTMKENTNLMMKAGFNIVECIWTDIAFSAWIAVKE
ncbi:MAG: methyltransferase domain-containing protein [Clostridiales bacterium]|jgi:tRNA (cmo5U34)-methyltransferase|nr:methyltransferase domain-containing protein [Clostridiales bacterium]